MKTTLKILLLALFAAQSTGAAVQKDLYSYILKLQLPAEVELKEAFCGFYKGKPITFEKNWALLPEDDESCTFSVIVTPAIGFKKEGKNVRYIYRQEDQPFCWYDLTLHSKNNIHTWDIKKLPRHEAPLQLPDHAVVILLNPALIETLKAMPQPSCTKQAESYVLNAPQIVSLPTIMLNNVSTEELEEACVEALLSSVELRSIHKKPVPEIKREQLAILALCKN